MRRKQKLCAVCSMYYGTTTVLYCKHNNNTLESILYLLLVYHSLQIIPRITQLKFVSDQVTLNMAEMSDESWATRPTKLPKEELGFLTADVVSTTLNPEDPSAISSTGHNKKHLAIHDQDSMYSKETVESSTATSNYLPSTAEPLSWHDARSVMREVLNRYMDSSHSNDDHDENESERQSAISLLQKIDIFWFGYNLDCYLGSILVSMALLVLSTILYIQERNAQKNSIGIISEESVVKRRLYVSHITASVLLLFSSILSVWLVHRRRLTSVRGAETKKRNTIASFLPLLDEMLSHSKGSTSVLPMGHEDLMEILPGSSLTDIYPVYRLSSEGDGKEGQWHKVPSLLIVEGDFIALQLGDIAPVDCKLATGSKMGTTQSSSLKIMSAPNLKAMGAAVGSQRAPKLPKEPFVIKAGDRVELPKNSRAENKPNMQVCDPLFLPGKSKLTENSRKLSHLTNRAKVFQVLESPIARYLRKSLGTFCSRFMVL